MYQYIENLRKKPDHHKKKVALLAAGVVTGAMFIAWASVIFPSNTQAILASAETANQSAVEQSPSPFESLKASVGSAIESIKSLFQNKADTFNFGDQYSKMKDEVQSGQIQLAPQNTAGTAQ